MKYVQPQGCVLKNTRKREERKGGHNERETRSLNMSFSMLKFNPVVNNCLNRLVYKRACSQVFYFWHGQSQWGVSCFVEGEGLLKDGLTMMTSMQKVF